jgi:class 3 adenylate cyclase/tetratricopeptide (TPR) repeat protein
MRCPGGHDNVVGARFCNVCASPLEIRCPACGHTNPLASRFCNECAAKLRAGAPAREETLTSRTALEGERKQVTVLFADLKGSTELLAHRDPEDARRILDPVLELMMEAVHRYDGTVNQVMGDGIMALFGAPIAQEDHAVRACYAALRMQEAASRHAVGVEQAEGILIQIRVGVNSGEVVVRSIGSDLRMDYTAVGQVTHLAARMEQLALPGTTLLTASTVALVAGYVVVRPLGEREVKGLGRPLPVYELVGLGPARSRLDTYAGRRLTPFVGRDAELHRLRATLRLVRRGPGRIVGVIGGAGVGKSRLIHEFIGAPELQGWRVLMAQAALFSQGTPYAAVVDLLRSYFGVESRDGSEQIRERVQATLRALGVSLEATFPALLALLDIPPNDPLWDMLDPPERRRRTIEGVVQVLLREAMIQPVLVVMEDLHWIDRESDAVLARLGAEIRSAPLMLLLNYRPENEPQWRESSIFSEFRLQPLSPPGAEQLLLRVFGDDATLNGVKRLLVERTGGNPFFLEEMLRELIETGVLISERAGYRVAGDLMGLGVPATVQAVLASRIDRLAPIDKVLLQAASVIGETVPLRILEAAGHLSGDELSDAVARLQRAEFVYPAVSVPDMHYHFKHALTRDVVYGTLLKEQRRVFHGQIVAAIERLYAERLGEQIELLAHHAVRGEMWEKAVDYLRDAGAKAASRGALTDSINRYEEALRIVDSLAPSLENTRRAVDVRLDFHVPLFPLGQTARLFELYRDAEGLARQQDDTSRLGRITYRLGAYCWVGADYTQGITYARRAIEIADARDDRELRLAATHVLGMNYEAPGEYHAAIGQLLSIVEGPDADVAKTRRGVTIPTYTAGCAWLSACFAELGDFRCAIAWGDRAIDAAETSQHALAAAVASTLRAYAPLYRGDFAEALPWCERSVALCDSKGLHGWRPAAYSAYGCALVGAGRSQQGLSFLERAVIFDEQTGIKTQLAHWFSRWAEGLLVAGHLGEASVTAERALSIARSHRERGNEARALYVLAGVTAARERPDCSDALQYYDGANELTATLGMRPLVAHCHLGIGKLYRRTDKREQAQEHLTTATTMYREMGMTYWLEKAAAETREAG